MKFVRCNGEIESLRQFLFTLTGTGGIFLAQQELGRLYVAPRSDVLDIQPHRLKRKRGAGEPPAVPRERPVLANVALYRVFLGTPSREPSSSPDSTHELRKARSSEKPLRVNADYIGVHQRNMDCHHAWHPSLGLRTNFLLECSLLGMVRIFLLCLLHAAYSDIDVVTKCRDGRLFNRTERPPGTGGILFPLLPGLVDLVRTAGVVGTL